MDKMNKILIMDDDNLIASTMGKFLIDKGYSVLICTEPISFFLRYPNFQPDLVLCDINMPMMDGMEVLRRIHEYNPLQKFIMVTGAFLNSIEFQILKEKSIPQIIKPPDMEYELSNIIKKQLNKRQLASKVQCKVQIIEDDKDIESVLTHYSTPLEHCAVGSSTMAHNANFLAGESQPDLVFEHSFKEMVS